MGHPGDIRTLKMAWQGRTLLSRVLKKVRVDFRQKMGERNSGQGLRKTNTTTESSLRCSGSYLSVSVPCSQKSQLRGNTPI